MAGSDRLTRAVVGSGAAFEARRDTTARADRRLRERQTAAETVRGNLRQWADEQVKAVAALRSEGERLIVPFALTPGGGSAMSLGLGPGGGGSAATLAPQAGLEAARRRAEGGTTGIRGALPDLETYSLRQRQIRFALIGVLLVFAAGAALLVNRQINESKVKDWNSQMRAIAPGTLVTTLSMREGTRSIAFAPNGQTLAALDYASNVMQWQLTDDQLLDEYQLPTLFSATISPQMDLIATGDVDGPVRIWVLQGGKLLMTVDGHTSNVNGVVFSGDGKTLTTGGPDNIKVWEVRSGSLLRTLDGQVYNYRNLVLSQDGRLLLENMNLWDMENGMLIDYVGEEYNSVAIAGISPDSHILASGSSDNAIRLIQLDSEIPLGTLVGHTSYLNQITFSADGQLIASGANDETVRVWRVEDGVLLHTFDGHAGGVSSLAFSPDGLLLASGSFDNYELRLWRVGDPFD